MWECLGLSQAALQLQFPVNAPWEAAAHGSGSWVPASMRETWHKFLLPRSSLAQFLVIVDMNKQMEDRCHSLLSFPLTSPPFSLPLK